MNQRPDTAEDAACLRKTGTPRRDRLTFASMRTGAVRRCLLMLVAAIAFGQLVMGCGVALRTPADSQSQVPTVAVAPADPYVRPDGGFVAPSVSVEPLVLQPGQTVVSITFDRNLRSQATAARMMSAHGLPGTFYVNSGTVGMPGYLSLPDLESIAMAGHEIGGHTLTHRDLAKLTPDEGRRQVCDDRKTLLAWGFSVRGFAFPFGSSSLENLNTVRECGYNSARGLGDLRSVESCEECDAAEGVPPANPMRTRAPDQVDNTWTTADLQGRVTDATATGGWLQLTFHGLCTADCSQVGTPQAQFEEFVTWLAHQQAQGLVLVSPVGDVIGGPVQPAVSGPVVPPAPPGANEVANPGLEEQVDGVPSCWMPGSFGHNSPEFSLTSNAHSGTTASRLVVHDYVDGDAKLLQTMDLGTCAPAVSAGRTYTVQAWYTSTAPTSFSVQYRLARGIWVFGLSSPTFAPTAQFSLARWTLPPIPQGVTAISFGMTLAQNGELVTDDYSLTDGNRGPH
jgi:peptidoglycan/xylan/chitin deacetylase (PgdA/CDA1 family)